MSGEKNKASGDDAPDAAASAVNFFGAKSSHWGHSTTPAEMPMLPADSVASPCINLCRLDAHTGLCEGCLRTLDEIAVWGSASDTQRRMILMDVEKRRERFSL